MARQDLFGTDTVNFLTLIGNGRRYRVPPYQRDYSWKEEQWEDLWNDILAIRTDPDARHYMGALVVEARSDRDFLVIDGQQRLATLSILAICVVEALRTLADREIEPDANSERAEGLWGTFVGETDYASLVRSSKLTLNEADNGFYQDYLVQNREVRAAMRLPRSNALLAGARDYFRKKIAATISNDGNTLASLLTETAARGLFFILITVEDESNAYTIFETLNARGLELSTTDLLKNYLFSRVTPGVDLEYLQRRWRSLVAHTTQERFPDFLRYDRLVRERQVRKERLFKAVRDEVRDAEGAINLVNRLEPRAETFAALADANHPLWSGNPQLRAHVEELLLFKVRQITPVVFAAVESFSADALSSILRLLVVVSFRYTVVGGRNTNELELAYHEAAQSIATGESKGPKDVFNKLRAIYVSDEAFRSEFVSWTIGGSQRKLAKYVLTKLESENEMPIDWTTDSGTVEHILPENPSEGWTTMIPFDQWDRAPYLIGNLTLLEPAKNRSIGNLEYGVKREVYLESRYASTRRLAEDAPEEWTMPHISGRAEHLARKAVQIWRVDF